MNIPENPAGYEFKVPENLKQYYDDDTMLNQARELFHGVNLSKEQFTAVMAADAMRVEESNKAMQENPMDFYKEILPLAGPVLLAEGEKAMREKWGDAYDSRLHYCKMAITENTKEGDERNILMERFGNDPDFADFVATMYLKSHTESNGVDTSLGHGSTSQNLDQRIAEIGTQLTQELKLQDRTKYNSLLIEKEKLFKQKFPEK